MEKKKSVTKIVFTVIFTILILGTFLLSKFYEFPAKWGVKTAYLYYGCICACFLYSILFIKANAKKIFVTLALAFNVAADFFLILAPELGLLKLTPAQIQFVGVALFCGTQFFYMLYTMWLTKGIGLKILNLALRVALCLVAYFVIPNYFALSNLEMLSVLYILNSFVTLIFLLFNVKREGLLFLGFLLFFVCDVFIGLNHCATFLGWSGAFFEFALKSDISSWVYIPGILLIATSSVWAKNRTE